jgi:hypothetical protein
MALIRVKASRGGSPYKAPGLFLAANPGTESAVRPNARLPRSGGHWRGSGFGRMKDWTTVRATAIEGRPKGGEWRPEFRKGAHYLTRIAERLGRG